MWTRVACGRDPRQRTLSPRCSDDARAAALRHVAGGQPVAFLNARLNAGSDS